MHFGPCGSLLERSDASVNRFFFPPTDKQLDDYMCMNSIHALPVRWLDFRTLSLEQFIRAALTALFIGDVDESSALIIRIRAPLAVFDLNPEYGGTSIPHSKVYISLIGISEREEYFDRGHASPMYVGTLTRTSIRTP